MEHITQGQTQQRPCSKSWEPIFRHQAGRAGWVLRGALMVLTWASAVPRHADLEKAKEVSRTLQPPGLGEECGGGGGWAEKRVAWGEDLKFPFLYSRGFIFVS